MTEFISQKILEDLLKEVERGVNKYGNYTSLDEGRLVIQREFNEMDEEIELLQLEGTLDTNSVRINSIREETLQVAATAIRFVHEIDIGLR